MLDNIPEDEKIEDDLDTLKNTYNQLNINNPDAYGINDSLNQTVFENIETEITKNNSLIEAKKNLVESITGSQVAKENNMTEAEINAVANKNVTWDPISNNVAVDNSTTTIANTLNETRETLSPQLNTGIPSYDPYADIPTTGFGVPSGPQPAAVSTPIPTVNDPMSDIPTTGFGVPVGPQPAALTGNVQSTTPLTNFQGPSGGIGGQGTFMMNLYMGREVQLKLH